MTDRLDRVENILAALTDELKATKEICDQNSIDIAATRAIAERNSIDIAATKAIADSNARAIEANANETALLKEAERSLFASQERLTVALIGLADTVAECNQRMDKTQSEIRGLRIETRRILERWLGEPFTDDPDNLSN
jgi:uncharacterized coiled-coil protein SlyX